MSALNTDTNDDVQDVTDQFNGVEKAERRGVNVLIMRKLDEPWERFDKKKARWELEYRWLSGEQAELCEVKGNEFSFWTDSEWNQDTSLFDQFDLF